MATLVILSGGSLQPVTTIIIHIYSGYRPVVRYVSQKKGSSGHFEQISIPALGESL